MPNEQLSQYPAEVIKIIKELEYQTQQLTLLVMKTPTSNVRNDLTSANIHLMTAVSDLKNVV